MGIGLGSGKEGGSGKELGWDKEVESGRDKNRG